VKEYANYNFMKIKINEKENEDDRDIHTHINYIYILQLTMDDNGWEEVELSLCYSVWPNKLNKLKKILLLHVVSSLSVYIMTYRIKMFNCSSHECATCVKIKYQRQKRCEKLMMRDFRIKLHCWQVLKESRCSIKLNADEYALINP